MYNLHNEMVKFHNNHVALSGKETKELLGFKKINIKRLTDGFAEINTEKNKGYSIAENVVQGSVAMFTVTQNDECDYDIDVAVIFDKDNIPSNALDCRKLVEDAIGRKAKNFVNPPKAGTNAVRIQYQEGYHIDFAVYRRFKNENDEYEYEHAGSDWAKRHPRGIRDWFNERVKTLSPDKSNEDVSVENNQLRRIVKLLKMFCRSRSKWSLPGGVILTTLAVECYKPNNTRDDQAFYETLVAIKNRIVLSDEVKNPTDSSLSLTPKENHRKRVTKLKECIEEKLKCLEPLFEVGCIETDAKKAWKAFFKHDFWNTTLQKSAVYTDSLNHVAQHPEVHPLEIRYMLYDDSKINRLSYKKNRKGNKVNPKHCWLMFEAIHNTAAPYEVIWEVHNSGDEAEDANHLYHQTKMDWNEGPYHWESTSYKGTHTMTATVKKNGQSVAKKSINVEIL
jgi:hypothetical protein